MSERAEADFEAMVLMANDGLYSGGEELHKAYREAVGGIAYNGEKIPEWENIRWRAKWGWICAYHAAEIIIAENDPTR